MPATILNENNDIYLIRVSGTLLKTEFGKVQDGLAIGIDAGVKPRVLVILENFDGFEMGAEWGDFEFLHTHSHKIEKIAIVGDAQWERNALAFAGAGFRRAPVEFFPSEEEAQARAWLAA